MARIFKRLRASEEPPTLFDRFVVAFYAGLLTFVLGSLLLILPFPFGLGAAFKGAFYILLITSAVFAALGFALRINVVADSIARLADAVLRWWR